MSATIKNNTDDKHVMTVTGYFAKNPTDSNCAPIFTATDRTKPMPSNIDTGVVFNDTKKFKRGHNYTITYSIANYMSDSNYWASDSYIVKSYDFDVK